MMDGWMDGWMDGSIYIRLHYIRPTLYFDRFNPHTVLKKNLFRDK